MLTTFDKFDSFLKITSEAPLNCSTPLQLLTAWLVICHMRGYTFALKQLQEQN